MVRLLNDFTLVCKTMETGEKLCACDFRVNIYECPHSEFYVTSGKVLIILCIILTIMSGGSLICLTKIKKQPFFLPASKERGWLRPRPLHSYHLIVLTYMFLEAVHLILLTTESYPNMQAVEIGNIMANVVAGSVAIFYAVSIVYSTPNIKFNENHEILNKKKWMSTRLVDIIAIVLFLQPIFTWIPLALLTGYFAEINDIKKANILYTAHYLTIVAWEIIYLVVLTYFWYRLMSIIKGYVKILEERHISSGVIDSNHIESIRKRTRNITLPVMATVIGLLAQAVIFVIMSLTHRNNTIWTFEWNVFYYWIQYSANPIIGFFAECFLTYQTLTSCEKSPGGSNASSSSGQISN